ncbi:YhcN/YlaJ family sporulation lipoprotein [Falsibacillus albus]|uniref:Spore cortex protein CoxA n=1 Tax=Falsibacillus albus TaxID=2478915 RepID=A0A3L7K7E6_9BACI|nr:YhcN/YlaJ family sporulation lipoprotein [Falsibacillus albus]RLQ98081.1 spore cortex protein CoxA [Falsibacillus albus]
MNKRYLFWPLSALLLCGAAGCGSNEAGNNKGTNLYEPMGYYSNSGHGGDRNDQNDGPLTEFMDHSMGAEGRAIRNHKQKYLQVKDEDGNPQNPNVPLSAYDRNFFHHDNRFSYGDANYHGHLDDNTRQAKSSYYTRYEGQLSERIGQVTGNVPNVNDVRSVTYGSNVLIAVDLEDYSKEKQTKEKIKKAVKPYLKGRSVTVVTDEGTFSRIRNIDNDLRDGGPIQSIDLDMKDLFKTLKNRMNQ